jgi:FMN-dependent NADH-azoreductase
MKLLHISSSPRSPESQSLAVADEFLRAYAAANPSHEIEHWDLWDGSLPDFRVGASAKMTVFAGRTPTGEQAEAWAAARAVFDRFDSADKLLFSVPMWNSSVPYVLKQFIDIVSQPGWVFGVDAATGYTGLYAPRPVAVVYSSAVWGPGLPPAFGANHQSTFFGDWLRWAGISDISEIRFHPTLSGDYEAAREVAYSDARDLAKRF